MSNVNVTITGSLSGPQSVLTPTQGTFSLVFPANQTFTGIALRNDPTSGCGLSELDITPIQRYVLNLSNFLQPWEMIAADANLSGTVNTLDGQVIRGVILNGNQLSQEWVCIPANNYNGLPAPTPASVSNVVPPFNTTMQVSVPGTNTFFGIKYGDVDGSGTTCATNPLSAPLANKFFKLGKAQNQKDNTVLIPVYGKQFESQMLFSLGLSLDPDKMEVLELLPASLPEFNKDCYALDPNHPGLVNVLWFNSLNKSGISVKSNEPLFLIKARLLDSNAKVSAKTVQLSYDRLQNIAFDASNKKENIGLEFEEAEGGMDLNSLPKPGDTKLKQAIFPNPFDKQLNLNIEVREAVQASIQFFSQDGRLLKEQKLELVKGQNQFQVDQLNNLPKGIILYRINLPDRIETGKLIKE